MYVKLNMYGCTHVRDGTDVPVFADTCTRANDASNCTAVCSILSALFHSPVPRDNSFCVRSKRQFPEVESFFR